MKNFLYTTGIFLLLLSPATCNYENSSLLRTEADGTIVTDLPDEASEYAETTTTTILESSSTCEDGDPLKKPHKP